MQALDERMHALDERMINVERTNDGFRDEARNVWVPGSLQMLTSLNNRVDGLTKAIWLSGALMAMVVAHQYGLADALLRIIGGR